MAGTQWTRRATLLAAALLLLARSGLTQGAGNNDQRKFQGDWIVVAAEKGGDKVPDEIVKTIKAQFQGDKVKLAFLGDVKQGTVKLDETRNPKTIDLTLDDKTMQGIYQVLKADQIQVCLASPGEPRPKKFESPANSEIMLVTFQRQAGAEGKAVHRPQGRRELPQRSG